MKESNKGLKSRLQSANGSDGRDKRGDKGLVVDTVIGERCHLKDGL